MKCEWCKWNIKILDTFIKGLKTWNQARWVHNSVGQDISYCKVLMPIKNMFLWKLCVLNLQLALNSYHKAKIINIGSWWTQVILIWNKVFFVMELSYSSYIQLFSLNQMYILNSNNLFLSSHMPISPKICD